MATRADFYVGKGEEAEWLGSIAFDGYPQGIPDDILKATDEQEYREEVHAELLSRQDGTLPEMGWPWPWDDSNTTDYAYSFDCGCVYASNFGGVWYKATGEAPEDDGEHVNISVFPDMSARKNLAMGTPRDSILIISR